MKTLLTILFTLLACTTAQAEDSPANWDLFDRPTASASYEADNSGTLSLSHGAGSVRTTSYAKYRKFDHTEVGITVEATMAHRFWNRDRYSALFASPRLTISHDLGTGLVGGETALRVGFVTMQDPEMRGWGFMSIEVVKVTNAQWEFRFLGNIWSRVADTDVDFGAAFGMTNYEGHSGPLRTTGSGLIGLRLRAPVFEFGLTVTVGLDVMVGGGEEWYAASDFYSGPGGLYEGRSGAKFSWFLVFEWRG